MVPIFVNLYIYQCVSEGSVRVLLRTIRLFHSVTTERTLQTFVTFSWQILPRSCFHQIMFWITIVFKYPCSPDLSYHPAINRSFDLCRFIILELPYLYVKLNYTFGYIRSRNRIESRTLIEQNSNHRGFVTISGNDYRHNAGEGASERSSSGPRVLHIHRLLR